MADIMDASRQFDARKCPPGSLAKHALHGTVRVVGADGARRTIEVDDSVMVDEPVGVGQRHSATLGDRLLGLEQSTVAEVEVLVTELVGLDPFRDMEPVTCGVVLHAAFGLRIVAP